CSASAGPVAPGNLDATFGAGGKVAANFGFYSTRGYGMAVQSDGKIVVAGGLGGLFWNGSYRDFALVRYMASGALDPSFGTGGMVTTPIGSGDDSGYSVAVQSDGKIVVAGVSNNGSSQDIALVRYTDSGVLDSSFGTGGIVTTDFGGSQDF